MRTLPSSVAARAFCATTLLAGALAGCSRPAPVAVADANTTATPTASATPSTSSSTTAPAAARTAQFKIGGQTLTVPAGFTVELVAAPPMVNRPISIAFDEQGRLYATDSSGLSDRAPVQFEQKPHRVVRLEDNDGDGRFDQSTVFAEKMMFPQGALFYEGSLYVGAPPHIWKLTDRNGDGVSDERVEWYDGKTLTGCANDLHGPYLGLDGRIYWTKGASAEQTHNLAGNRTLVSRAAHIMRSKADGTDREIMLTGGMDNPVGVTFTATGERILSGTFFQIGTPGKRDGLIHAIWGGVYGKDQPSIVGHTRTGDLMPIMTHMGAAAPCGSTTYRSRVFGADYADNLFVCYFNLRKISRHQVVADGAAYKTIDTDFITSDSLDFHPTDVLEDADGSLLVVDTGGWYKICCPTSQLAKPDVLGGIYRIRKVGAPKTDDPRGLRQPWATMGAPDLARLLSDERPYVHERATHQLGKAGDSAVAAIQQHALKSTSVAARRNALWALARIDTPAARDAVRSALADRDVSVVHTALQVTSLLRDAKSVDALKPFLAGDNLAHLRLAAEALGRIANAGAVDALLATTRHLRGDQFTATGTPANSAERILEHAITFALIEIGAHEALRAKLSSSRDPRLLRVVAIALDQISGGGLKPQDIIGWLESNETVLKRTAGWIVNRHPEWGDALAVFFRGQLAGKSQQPADRAELQTQLASLAKAGAIQELLANTAADAKAPKETRLLALRAMATSGVKETPAAWLTQLARLLQAGSPDPEIARQAVVTARGLPLPKNGHAELAASLARTGRDAALPADVRLDALAATTPAAIQSVEPELFQFVCAQLDAKNTMPVRGAAASVLAKAPLSPDQQMALADTMKTVGPLEAAKVLPAFEKKPTEALGLRVVAALRGSPGLAGLRANNLRPVFAKYSKPVQQKAEELVSMVNAESARQNARVDELMPGMKDGDIRRGQAVFQGAKAACSLCHTVGYLGGRMGPDLTGIGKIRDERELLEAIIFPSATFVRGYEPVIVTTKAGEGHSGILKKDAPDEVLLATGPDSEQRVTRGDVKNIEPSPVSPMPPGMDVILTKQELADLVAFLKSRT